MVKEYTKYKYRIYYTDIHKQTVQGYIEEIPNQKNHLVCILDKYDKIVHIALSSIVLIEENFMYGYVESDTQMHYL